MKLYLVQHGDALGKEADPDRPLSRQGRDDVTRMAVFLQGKCRPARICHSGKSRARQTAELLAAALAPDCAIDVLPGIGPNDPVTPLADVGDEVLLVGHLPFLAKLVTTLVTGRESPVIVDYRPGSILCLALHGDAGWTIQWMMRPDLLGD